MAIRLLFAVLLLTAVCAAQTTSTKGEALDKVQVAALLAADIPNSRVASLVVERGISFQPSDRYIQLLQKAGADDGVVTAVRVAQRPPEAPKGENASSGNGPLHRDQILDLLQTAVDSSVLAKLVATRGIDFDPYDEYLHVYSLAGAKENLLGAIRTAGEPKRVAAPALTSTKQAGSLPAAGGAAATKRLRVPGEISAARLIYKPAPAYPELAKIARIQGVVRLQALIGEDGTIEDLKALTGHPLLIKPSLVTVSTWRYRPMLLNGKPVEVETEIDVNFTLGP